PSSTWTSPPSRWWACPPVGKKGGEGVGFPPGTGAAPRSGCDPSPFDLAYALGLIVGEGYFTGPPGRPTLAVKLRPDDELPLLHLRAVFGGDIYGPYRNRTAGYQVWVLRGNGLRSVLGLLWRYLPESRKRDQFKAWCAKHGL